MTGRVQVTRSGGLAGLRVTVDVDLDTPAGSDLRALLRSGRLAAAVGGRPEPDRYAYRLTGDVLDLTVQEQHLTPADREVLEAALRS